MAYHREQKICSCIQALFVSLVIIAAPAFSFSAEQIHTIQIASFLDERRAVQQYNQVLGGLNPSDLTNLRIEKIGRYYALRLGKFADAGDAAKLFKIVKSSYPGAMLMTATAKSYPLYKMYGATLEEEADPVKVEADPVKVEADPVKVEADPVKVEADPVKVEAGLVPVVPRNEPEKVPAEQTSEAQSGKTIDVVPEPPETLPVSGFAAMPPPALMGGGPPATTDAEAKVMISNSLLIIFSTAIFLIMAGFYLRELARLGAFEVFLEEFPSTVDTAETVGVRENDATEEAKNSPVAMAAESEACREQERCATFEDGLDENTQNFRNSEPGEAAEKVTEAKEDIPAADRTELTSSENIVWVNFGGTKTVEKSPDDQATYTVVLADEIKTETTETVRTIPLVTESKTTDLNEAELSDSQEEGPLTDKTEAVRSIPLVTESKATDLNEAEFTDSQEEGPLTDKKENRVKSAVESVMLVAKDKY